MSLLPAGFDAWKTDAPGHDLSEIEEDVFMDAYNLAMQTDPEGDDLTWDRAGHAALDRYRRDLEDRAYDSQAGHYS